MALKQETVRLLVADDVGVGKTIEAALVARELLDRGEIDRFAVLCPPHLVDQWTAELENRFNLRAVPVTAASAGRLEKGLPLGDSIFRAHPFTVVSLDYIKSERRRDEFLRACPELVIVDEAHTCAATSSGRHQRYELLKGLVGDAGRHLVMLTATPHSGDEDAFYRLLGLLDPAFAGLEQAAGPEREKLRDRLSLHFVQRRRPDISEWKEGNLFPKREVKQLTYQLTGEWDQFFENVLDYCAGVVAKAGGDERAQRLGFWGTLALMRCVASSPAAAAQALRTRAGIDGEVDEEALADRLFDGASDALTEDDLEPPAATEERVLAGLIESAEKLSGQKGDPKLKLLADHLGQLLEEGFSPVVFCRYIATAKYLGEHLKDRFKGVTVGVVTGELASEERREKVEVLGDADKRLLIATDCLSEGVNLQEHFDAVVHYDLSWNPTRHEQREGRVDRFGQDSKVVRATLIYGANNPVDGAVLDVILRKAEKIREELGVPVPLPDEGHTLTQALMKAVLLRRGAERKQRVLDLATIPEARAVDAKWTDAAERARANRTVFAQRRLKPEEVLPEWRKTLAAVGGGEDVQRFVGRALKRLGTGLEEGKRGAFKATLTEPLPEDLLERLSAEGLAGTPLVSFRYPPAPRSRPVQRSHPLVAVLAETLLERTLAEAGANGNGDSKDPGVLGRVGCWISDGVTERTTVALLRLRHQLTSQRGGRAGTLLVEEAAAIGWKGVKSPVLIEGLDALALLSPAAIADPPANVTTRTIAQALELLAGKREELTRFAYARADALLADHRRVRTAAEAKGKYAVKALLPADVIGLYVLLPKVS
jgi:superfamily II DNA or RNA helicase